ncbi:MAG TPA: hypothetical protein VE153_34400 [Myxococcus sp.]|nr:hypothetical protein [Myxococcus sp.]
MRVLAVLKGAAVRALLRQLGLLDEPLRVAPSRGPPEAAWLH